MTTMKKGMLAVGVAGALFLTGITGITSAQQDRNANNGNSNNRNRSTTNRNSTTGNQNTTTAESTTMSTGTMSDGNMVGNMSREEFDRINAQGAATVAAIQPTSGQLSKRDQDLMMDVAKGGMMQLEISRAALNGLTNPEARILAQSEVEEQTALSAKLREIATAKGVTLPMEQDSKTQSMITKMQGRTGMELDSYYLKESGVKGHEKLEKTMTKVQANAEDPALKSLASAALPLVQTHLRVSQEALNKMNGAGGGSSRSNNRSDRNTNSGSTTNSNDNSNKR